MHFGFGIGDFVATWDTSYSSVSSYDKKYVPCSITYGTDFHDAISEVQREATKRPVVKTNTYGDQRKSSEGKKNLELACE